MMFDAIKNLLNISNTKALRTKVWESKQDILKAEEVLRHEHNAYNLLCNECETLLSISTDDVITAHLKEKLQKGEDEMILDIQKSTVAKKEAIDILNTTFLDLFKGLSKYGDYLYKSHLKFGIGVARNVMPQVDDAPKLREQLSLSEEQVALGDLLPTQQDISEEKVMSMMATGYSLPTAFIVSKDNHIMDGHHRWAASLELYPPNHLVTVYKSDKDCLEFYDELAKSCGHKKVAFYGTLMDNKGLLDEVTKSDTSKGWPTAIVDHYSTTENSLGYPNIEAEKGRTAHAMAMYLTKAEYEAVCKYEDHYNPIDVTLSDGSVAKCFKLKGKFNKASEYQGIADEKLNKWGLKKEYHAMPIAEFLNSYGEYIKAKESDEQVYCSGICQDMEGRILLLKRPDDDDFAFSVWCLPGGRVEDNEPAHYAMRREFEEETNLKPIAVQHIKEIVEGDACIHYYHVIADESKPLALLDSESVQYEWVPLDDLGEYDLMLDTYKHLANIFELEPIEKGIYVNNPENRKLGRVGQQYGGVGVGGDVEFTAKGGNKVVDKQGNPLTVYHGSSFDDIKKFNPESNLVRSADSFGTWFSSSEGVAKKFGDTVDKPATVYPANLSIKNPWVLDGDKGFDEYIRVFKDKTGVSHPALAKRSDIEKFREYLKLSGKDGLIMTGLSEANGATYYVALDSDQIKMKSGVGVEFTAKGGNKVVDKTTGKPIRVFSGKRIGGKFGLGYGTEDIGEYFTDNPTEADYYSIGKIGKKAFDEGRISPATFPAYVKLKNPYVMDSIGYASIIHDTTRHNRKQVIKEIKDKGHDGIIVTGVGEELDNYTGKKSTWYIPFNNKNVISAIGKSEEIDIMKGAKGKPLDKSHLVPKKVLVVAKGKKPYWTTKHVNPFKEVESNVTPFKMALSVLSAKLKMAEEDFLSIAEDIENVVIDSVVYELSSQEGSIMSLKKVGIHEGKKPLVFLKEEPVKVEKKETEKFEIDDDKAFKVVEFAFNNQGVIKIGVQTFKIYKYNKESNEVSVSIKDIDSDAIVKNTLPLDEFVKLVGDELQKKYQAKKAEKIKLVFDPSIKDEDYKEIKKLGGSTGAVLVEDDNGVKWVRKSGASNAHKKSEKLALNLYGYMGINVPTETKESKDYIYNRFVEGVPLGKWEIGKSEEDIKAMHEKISKGFVVDALLGNWDVVGLAKDNIIVDESNCPIRVDVGGSLNYRAQGEKKKPSEWEKSGKVEELETLLDSKLNPQSSEVFKDISIKDIMQQVNALKHIPAYVPLEDRKVLEKRLDWLKEQYSGLPTGLDEMSDTFEAPIGAKGEVKQFYSKLNKVMAFTPKDQLTLSQLAEAGDSECHALLTDEWAMKRLSNAPKDYMDEIAKMKVSPRELYAIVLHTGGSFSGFNAALREVVGNQYNIVTEGKVIKYKPEFEEMAKKAFSANTHVAEALFEYQTMVNRAVNKKSRETYGHYGIPQIQDLGEIKESLKTSMKNPENELEKGIADFYYHHAEKIWDAYEKKTTYDGVIGEWIPEDKVKDKYAEVVDMSLVKKPVEWGDIPISPPKKKASGKGVQGELFSLLAPTGTEQVAEKNQGILSWSGSKIAKNLIITKLISRGLSKVEKFTGHSPYRLTTPVSRKLGVGQNNEFIDQHKEGNEVIWVPTGSTSFGNTWTGDTVCKVHPKGILNVAPVSNYPNEKEATLKPFSRVKVLKVLGDGNHRVYEIQQLG